MEGAGVHAQKGVRTNFLDVGASRGEDFLAGLFVIETSAREDQRALGSGLTLDDIDDLAQIEHLKALRRGASAFRSLGFGARGSGLGSWRRTGL